MPLRRWSGALALLFLCSSSPAAANGWGREWLEKLSGPGPFAGIGLQFPVGCRWNTPGDQKFFWSFQTPIGMTPAEGDNSAGRQGQLRDPASTRQLCIDFQFTSATNKDSEEVGLIALRALEGRVGFPLERGPWWAAAFEPSIAVGAFKFQGDDFGEWRLALSPEIVIKPLKFIRPAQGKVRNPNKRGDWRGLVEFAYGAVLIAPKITNEDLEVTFLPPFEHGWLQRAVIFRVNASELVGLR